MAGSFPNKSKAPLYPHTISPRASTRQPRQRVNVPVHQAWWHWEHRVPLPYPDVLPGDLDPDNLDPGPDPDLDPSDLDPCPNPATDPSLW
ncbi:hypothetical protein D1007_48963 [Hordeum vulgare]|nr:hypothetical protein D1007_48963 [Hordeum vulgare]